MFEVFDGQPRQNRSATPVILSIVGHLVLVSLVIVVPLLYATDNLPRVPDMMAFVASVPEAPPPPPPPPPPPQAAAQEPPKVLPADAYAAPVEAPSEIRPEMPDLPVASRDGVEGGIVGGVQGGIVEGLSVAPPPPPPPPPAPKQAVRVGGNIQAPTLVKRVEPTYPDLALVAKVTGMVILEASVGADGGVESVRVLRSVKFLDEAAIAAVKQWRYAPLVLNGIATPFVLTVTLNFSVKES
ncbi:MAG TPA: TonB family protein [Vicinamibacterales bacterium]|nr:TonB family protein [Vicinamibacterales bacterium]